LLALLGVHPLLHISMIKVKMDVGAVGKRSVHWMYLAQGWVEE
jgi:hypothetical protein